MTTFPAWVTEMFTFRKNGYTVAMAFATKIVEIQRLPLTKIGFLMYHAGMYYKSFQWQGVMIGWWPIAATYQDSGNVKPKVLEVYGNPSWYSPTSLHHENSMEGLPSFSSTCVQTNWRAAGPYKGESDEKYWQVSEKVKVHLQKYMWVFIWYQWKSESSSKKGAYVWTRRYPGYLQILQSFWGKLNRRHMWDSCTGNNLFFWVHQWALHIHVVHEWECENWARRWENQW